MSVCIISFSSRADGNCKAIGEYVRSFHDDSTMIFNFSGFNITPCGNCHYECFKANSQCPYSNDKVEEICNTIIGSDLTYFIMPNYNDFPCANFFIFNERSQGYFHTHPKKQNSYENIPKKFIVVSNTNRENFRTVFNYHVSHSVTPNILYLSAKSYHKSSIGDNILTSGEARDDIKSFILNRKEQSFEKE